MGQSLSSTSCSDLNTQSFHEIKPDPDHIKYLSISISPHIQHTEFQQRNLQSLTGLHSFAQEDSSDKTKKKNRAAASDRALFALFSSDHSTRDLTLRLSDECLACVFQKLDSLDDRSNCSLVCKRWLRVEAKSRDRLNVHVTDDSQLSNPNSKLVSPDQAFVCLLTRFEFISYLSLRCTSSNNASTNNIKKPVVDDVALLLIARHCRYLTRLKLKRCRSITDHGLAQFAKIAGPKLKKFSCLSCGFGSHGLNMLIQMCSNLEDLSIKRLRRLRENQEAILPLPDGSSKIRTLCLKEIPACHLFAPLIAGSKRIQTLILANNPGFWDGFFEHSSEHLPELLELHIECLSMGDAALRSIAKHCSKLQVLHVSKAAYCTDDGYSAIANRCKFLRKLYIDDRRPRRVGDAGLITVAQNCKSLEELVLIGTNVTEKSLALIAGNCSGLERMALCNNDGIGDKEIEWIARKCLSLKKLCIKNCPISNYGLILLIDGCPSLCKLKVKKCRNVTDALIILSEMNRPLLTVSLDDDVPVLQPQDDHHQHQAVDGNDGGEARVVIRNSTLVLCSSRSSFIHSRLGMAASNLLRRFPKPS